MTNGAMSTYELVDRFTEWLSRCENESTKRGSGDKHAEWALGSWDSYASGLVTLGGGSRDQRTT